MNLEYIFLTIIIKKLLFVQHVSQIFYHEQNCKCSKGVLYTIFLEILVRTK